MNFDKIYSKYATSTCLDMHSFYFIDNKSVLDQFWLEFVNLLKRIHVKLSGIRIIRMHFVKIPYLIHETTESVVLTVVRDSAFRVPDMFHLKTFGSNLPLCSGE